MEALRGFDGQAGGRADGGQDRDAGHEGFLHKLEAGAAAHEDETVLERHMARENFGADQFVDGVMAADVFAQELEIALRIEKRGGVQPAGSFEYSLLRARSVSGRL